MTTLGTVGSGLDVESIVRALVDAEIAPKVNSLDRKESGLQAELSAIGKLKSSLTSLDASLEALSNGSAFDQLKVTSPASVDVTQSGTPSVGRYSIEVTSLAASQVLASPSFSSPSATVGTGTLTIQVGTPSYSTGSSGAYSGFSVDASKTVAITIDSSNNTLSGIRDAVNASGAPITASLVSDGGQTRLLFSADDSGASNAVSIVVDDDDLGDTDSSGLSSLAYNLDTSGGGASFVGNLTETRSAKDAAFSLNGLSLTSSSNTITSLIDGLDFKLRQVTSSAESVVVEKDNVGVEAAVQNFVTAYNNYQTTLSALMDYQDAQGALAGDATARRIQSALRSATTGEVSITGNSYTALSQLGIEADRYGKLTLTSSEFQSALSTNAEDLKEFFAGVTTINSDVVTDPTDTQGLADVIRSTIDTYIDSSNGMLVSREDRIDTAIDDIGDDRLDVLARISSLEERYTRQFTAMDTLVSRLQGTSDFLTNQMDAIKAAANR